MGTGRPLHDEVETLAQDRTPGLTRARVRSRLRGRDRQVRAAVDALTGAPNRSVVVVGESGSGKTAVLNLLRTSLADEFHVVTVRTSAVTARSDYASLGLLLSELDEEELVHPFRVLEGLITSLGRQGGSLPTLITVDNAEVIDGRSAWVLAELCARGAARLLLTSADADHLDHGLQGMLADGDLVRVDLPPLSLSEAGEVLADELGRPASRLATYSVWEAAAGNPRYLQMVRMSLVADGRLSVRNGIWVLQGSMQGTGNAPELVLQRLHGMAEDQRRAVDILACVRELPLTVLVELAGPEVVDDLLTLRLLLVDQRRTPVARLRHPGLGEVVRSQLSLLRRRALRTEVLDVIGGRPLPPATRAGLIEWAVDAREPVAADEVLVAAEFALQTLDPARAARLVKLFPRRSDDVRALIVATEVLCSSGEYGRAAEDLAAWHRLDLEIEDADFVDLMIAEQGVHRNLPDGYTAAGDLLVAARARTGDDDALLARIGRAEVELAAHQGHFAGIIDTHLPDGLEAVMPVEGEPLEEGEAARLGWIAESLAHVGRADDARRLIEAVIARVPQDGVEPIARFALIEHRFFIRLLSADFSGCRELLRIDTDSRQRPSPLAVLLGELWEGLVDTVTGNADSALDSLNRAVAQLGVDGRAAALPLALAAAAYTNAVLGRTDEARALLRSLDDYPDNAEWLVRRYAQFFRSSVALLLDDKTRAVARLLEESRQEERNGLYQTAIELSIVATLTGDRDAAEHTERLGRRVQGRFGRLGRELATGMLTHEPTALLTAGETAEDFELYQVVVATAEAVMEAPSASTEHRRAARRLLRRGNLRTASPASAARLISELTPMERELAAAVADGATNEELGASLHLSRRTVEWHLANVYEKLSVGGRTDVRTLVRLAGQRP